MKRFKKILKWLGIVIVFLAVVPISVMWLSFKLDEFNANSDIHAIYKKLEVGMSSENMQNIYEGFGSHVGTWHTGDDGTMPTLKDREVVDTFCVLAPNEKITFSDGNYGYYAMQTTDLIGFTTDTDKCYSTFTIKSIYLMSANGDVLKEKL